MIDSWLFFFSDLAYALPSHIYTTWSSLQLENDYLRNTVTGWNVDITVQVTSEKEEIEKSFSLPPCFLSLSLSVRIMNEPPSFPPSLLRGRIKPSVMVLNAIGKKEHVLALWAWGSFFLFFSIQQRVCSFPISTLDSRLDCYMLAFFLRFIPGRVRNSSNQRGVIALWSWIFDIIFFFSDCLIGCLARTWSSTSGATIQYHVS